MKINALTYPLLLLLMLLWASGCGNLYTGEGMEPPIVNPDPTDPEDPEDPMEEDPSKTEEMPIILSFTDPSYNSFGTPKTRGLGPFENDPNDPTVGKEVWENAIFYVYAFRSDDPLMSYEVQSKDDKETCLIDGSSESEPATYNGQYHGRKMTLNKDDASAIFNWKDSKQNVPYYSSLNQTRKFNFFAYYLDDAEVTGMTRNLDGIYIDFKINGTQDVLCAAARFTQEQEENASKVQNASERQNLQNYRYSTYTGHRNYMPVFTFPHNMTLLCVQAYGGELAADSIFIEGVEVVTKYKGRLTAAAKDTTKVGITFADETTKLPLLEKDGTIMKEDTIHFDDSDYLCDAEGNVIRDENKNPVGLNPAKGVYDRKPTPLGGGKMLTVPAEMYEVYFHLRQHYTDGRNPERYTAYYPVRVAGGFQPGTKYTLRVAVYGLQKIEIKVIITGWADGGNVDYDEDKENDRYN
ncbi:MAG: hypothetical protein ACI4C3_10100 [Bacteroides sp.]